MESLLNRYRNLTVLAGGDPGATGAAGLPGKEQRRSAADPRVGRQRRDSRGARASKPAAAASVHFFRDYFRPARTCARKTSASRRNSTASKMENQYLRTELSTADRAKSLAIFQQQSPSKTIAAHVIGNTTGVGAKVVIVDRGTGSGIRKGHGRDHAGWHRGQGDRRLSHGVLRAADHRSDVRRRRAFRRRIACTER